VAKNSEQQVKYKNNISQQESKYSDDDLLWKILWKGKLIIITISLLFAIASVLYALSKPNIYRASSLLAPVSSQGSAGGLAGLAGQFGGLASIAGINLSGSGNDKTAIAIEIIRSRSFIENFIEKHELLVPIIAGKRWDITSNSLILDNELYDNHTQKWVREVKAPKKTKPSNWEGYKKFLELLTVSQDEKTSMITIAIEFYSPELSKQWLLWLINDINEHMRLEDRKESQASIDYLYKQLDKIKVTTMETVFYQLIEEQTKNMMLAHVKDEYIFKTIDPAQVPQEKSSPKRALIVIIGTTFGGILSILFVISRYYLKSSKYSH